MKNIFAQFISLLAFIILVVAIPLLIVSTTVQVYSHSVALYTAGFEKYNISVKTGISDVQLRQVAMQMVDYFSGKSPTCQLTVNKNGEPLSLYNEKELIHMEDVRNIVQLFTILQIASIVIFVGVAILIYLKNGLAPLLKGIQIGAIVTAALTGVLIIWALIDFNSLFLIFHYISFTNNLWVLDPAKDYLIMMFPEGFFNDAAILIVFSILIEAAIIWLAAYLIKMVSIRKASAD